MRLLHNSICVLLGIISTATGFGLVNKNSLSNNNNNHHNHNHDNICFRRSGSIGSGSTTTTFPRRTTASTGSSVFRLFSKQKDNGDNDNDNDDDEDRWDGGFDYEKDWPTESSTSPDPSSDWNAPLSQTGLENMVADDGTPRLGIDIGSQLNPLTPREAEELRAEARQVINDAVSTGLGDIEKMRTKMKRELERNKRAMEFASDLNAQRETEKLMSKIDRITGDFMSETKSTRESTKLASRADRAMEGKGIEMGTWGVLGGASVVTGGALLGSVAKNAAAAAEATKTSSSTATGGNFLSEESLLSSPTTTTASTEAAKTEPTENRIMIVADTSQDKMAKQIVPDFVTKLEEAIPGIVTRVMKPTETMPLGCDNSACIVLFLSSLSDQNTVKNTLERALRRTIQPGSAMGQPPTQIIGVSTIGTERYDKLPYSMQNLMGGGKLEKRRQMEEAIINTIQRRVVSPPLDYTICKFGEIKDEKKELELFPGDVLDGNTPADTAVDVLLQAVAYQPFARNATLCAVGSSSSISVAQEEEEEEVFSFWNDAFLRLDGPEIFRMENVGDPGSFGELVEYLAEWSDLFAKTGKGLTTPIIAQPSVSPPNVEYQGVQERAGVKILFLPTATGKNYLSKEEELAREREATGTSSSSSTTMSNKNIGNDGGIEILVEVTSKNKNNKKEMLRIRAKRCNYPDGATVKEISEETILSRLRKAMDSWVSNKQ